MTMMTMMIFLPLNNNNNESSYHQQQEEDQVKGARHGADKSMLIYKVILHPTAWELVYELIIYFLIILLFWYPVILLSWYPVILLPFFLLLKYYCDSVIEPSTSAEPDIVPEPEPVLEEAEETPTTILGKQ